MELLILLLSLLLLQFLEIPSFARRMGKLSSVPMSVFLLVLFVGSNCFFGLTEGQPTVREVRFGDGGCNNGGGMKWPHHPHRRFSREWKTLVENILVELKRQTHQNNELRLEVEELRNTSGQHTQLLMDLTDNVNQLVHTLVDKQSRCRPCEEDGDDNNNNININNNINAGITLTPNETDEGNGDNDKGRNTWDTNRLVVEDNTIVSNNYGSGDRQTQSSRKTDSDLIENSTTNTFNDGPITNIFLINGTYPRDCDDILYNGRNVNGIYPIKPDFAPKPFNVECEFKDGKAWTLIQKRTNGAVNFYRNWKEYKEGFGKVGEEFWLGNEKIYYLSIQATYELRINMWDWSDVTRGSSPYTGNYYEGGSSFFYVEDEKNFYKLRVPEDFYAYQKQGSGSSGLRLHIGPFTTYDRKANALMENCAVKFHCGWWFRTCVRNSNLNGRYYQGGYRFAHNKTRSHDDIYWYSVDQSPRRTVMKIHRVSNVTAKTSKYLP